MADDRVHRLAICLMLVVFVSRGSLIVMSMLPVMVVWVAVHKITVAVFVIVADHLG